MKTFIKVLNIIKSLTKGLINLKRFLLFNVETKRS